MRTDEYYSNLDKVFTKMKRNPEKIVSSSMFFRKYGMYKFHCSDKLLGGATDNLIGMYEFNKGDESLDLQGIIESLLSNSKINLSAVNQIYQ